MTREEAEKILADAWIINPLTGAFQIYQGGLLDAFVALGMLKLEEQKNATEKFCGVVEGFGALTFRDANEIFSRLEAAGLRIVEK